MNQTRGLSAEEAERVRRESFQKIQQESRQRALEGRQGVFRGEAARTAVALRVESERGAGAPQREAQGGGAAPANPGEALHALRGVFVHGAQSDSVP